MEKKDGFLRIDWLKKGIMAECVLVVVLAAIALGKAGESAARDSASSHVLSIENDYIKWVDFTVSYEALCKAYEWDVETHGTEHEVDWVELLAYTAAKTGGEFGKDALKTMEKAAEKLSEGEITMEELAGDLKYYGYYREAYDAAIGGLVGEYWEETPDAGGNPSEENRGETVDGGSAPSEENREIEQIREGTETAGKQKGIGRTETDSISAGDAQAGNPDIGERDGCIKKYGLKGYFPLARGFDYTHYDDFGAGRSYGYKRKHLGHDMMGLVGTPIIAVESGVVEALGWNQYGGWRIGIRSFDGKRYYYYAHLRQNYPYAEGLEEGSVVTAGDVIGYMGHTGYSTTENVNNIKIVHLHWGLQLIFDESQKEGNNEIWIDVYPLTRFLAKHTQAAVKVEGTKEWRRTNQIMDPAVEAYEAGNSEKSKTPAREDFLENNHIVGNEPEQ